jgi:hypothetical protein
LRRGWEVLARARDEVVTPDCAVEALKPYLEEINAPVEGLNPAGKPVEARVAPNPEVAGIPQPALAAEFGKILGGVKCWGKACEHCEHRQEW